MPEIATGSEEWRTRLTDEMRALVPVDAHRFGARSPRFVEAKTERLLDDAKSLGHLLFTVRIAEADFLEYLGGATSATGYELHEMFADIEFAYRVNPRRREDSIKACRTLTRWVQHQITPGALSLGAGRVIDEAPLFATVRPSAKGPEWVVATIAVRAHVYVSRELAVVPA